MLWARCFWAVQETHGVRWGCRGGCCVDPGRESGGGNWVHGRATAGRDGCGDHLSLVVDETTVVLKRGDSPRRAR